MGGFLEQILSGGIKGAAEGIGSLAKDLRTAITGQTPLDPNRQAELLLKLQEYEFAMQKISAEFDIKQMEGQVALNLEEAKSESTFKSGWRPAVGWVCVLGLTYTFILKPLLPWTITCLEMIWGIDAAIPDLPEVPMGDLLILLGGLLGLGTMRTFEKVKGK